MSLCPDSFSSNQDQLIHDLDHCFALKHMHSKSLFKQYKLFLLYKLMCKLSFIKFQIGWSQIMFCRLFYLLNTAVTIWVRSLQ